MSSDKGGEKFLCEINLSFHCKVVLSAFECLPL